MHPRMQWCALHTTPQTAIKPPKPVVQTGMINHAWLLCWPVKTQSNERWKSGHLVMILSFICLPITCESLPLALPVVIFVICLGTTMDTFTETPVSWSASNLASHQWGPPAVSALPLPHVYFYWSKGREWLSVGSIWPQTCHQHCWHVCSWPTVPNRKAAKFH